MITTLELKGTNGASVKLEVGRCTEMTPEFAEANPYYADAHTYRITNDVGIVSDLFHSKQRKLYVMKLGLLKAAEYVNGGHDLQFLLPVETEEIPPRRLSR